MASNAVLTGVCEPYRKIPLAELALLDALKMPDKLAEIGQDMLLSIEEYVAFGKKAKENTSTYPDGLSFSTMKAGATSKLIANIECRLTRIPLKAGYAPSRWKNCLDVMILKWSGVTHLGSLRTVVLFSVDCNYAFKHIGRKMMINAEAAKALAPEQYGSRKFHRATDLAVNKSLTYDILRQRKQMGAVCSNDAKSCYDLIGHAQAAMTMRRMGVPKVAVGCIFTMLQEAIHRVRTGYGDPSDSYGGKPSGIPMHGICQGNGAGPAIWAVLSSPLMIYRGRGVLAFISLPHFPNRRCGLWGMPLWMIPIWYKHCKVEVTMKI
jgi:hypothetical protein